MIAEHTGKLRLFHTTMNGSKSANLLMQVYNFERQGKFILAFKPAIDTRTDDEIRSRAISESHQAYPIPKGSRGNMLEIVRKHRKKNISRIFIDEIQFFDPEQIDELAQIAIQYGIDIYCYGLLNSFTGKAFPSIIRCIEVGFIFEEMKMQCDLCENRASNHLLFVDGKVMRGEEAEVHVGDSEFKSVCYRCFDEVYNETINI